MHRTKKSKIITTKDIKSIHEKDKVTIKADPLEYTWISMETLKTRRFWKGVLQALKEYRCQYRLLDSAVANVAWESWEPGKEVNDRQRYQTLGSLQKQFLLSLLLIYCLASYYRYHTKILIKSYLNHFFLSFSLLCLSNPFLSQRTFLPGISLMPLVFWSQGPYLSYGLCLRKKPYMIWTPETPEKNYQSQMTNK